MHTNQHVHSIEHLVNLSNFHLDLRKPEHAIHHSLDYYQYYLCTISNKLIIHLQNYLNQIQGKIMWFHLRQHHPHQHLKYTAEDAVIAFAADIVMIIPKTTTTSSSRIYPKSRANCDLKQEPEKVKVQPNITTK